MPADDDHKAYFQGEQFGTILNYVQTHPRTASLKEKKEQLIVTFDEVKSYIVEGAVAMARGIGAQAR